MVRDDLPVEWVADLTNAVGPEPGCTGIDSTGLGDLCRAEYCWKAVETSQSRAGSNPSGSSRLGGYGLKASGDISSIGP
jgi:hypothetical protein